MKDLGMAADVAVCVPPDPFTGPFLLPGTTPLPLSILVVDLAGLDPGLASCVSLAGGPPGQETDAAGTVNGALLFSFAAGPTGEAGVASSPGDMVLRGGPRPDAPASDPPTPRCHSSRSATPLPCSSTHALRVSAQAPVRTLLARESGPPCLPSIVQAP